MAQVTAGTWSVSAIDLATADVTGLLPAANGGTGTNSSASTGIPHVTTGAWTYAAVNLASTDVTGLLPATKGGTGLDTSASTGVAQVTAGTWSVSAIDLATADVTGLLPAANGGTGTNSSASTGIAHVTAGAWTYAPIDLDSSDVTGVLPVLNGGTDSSSGVNLTSAIWDTSLWDTGIWSVVFGILPPAQGGTGLDTSASTGVAQITAGTWSVSAIDLATADVTGVLPIANGGTGSASGVDLTTSLVTGLLPASKGGTGTNSSAATGIAHVATGAWTYAPINLASGDVTGVLPPANGGAGERVPCRRRSRAICFTPRRRTRSRRWPRTPPPPAIWRTRARPTIPPEISGERRQRGDGHAADCEWRDGPDDGRPRAGASGLNTESATGVGDTAYTILATDRLVYTTAALTVSRAWTPAGGQRGQCGAHHLHRRCVRRDFVGEAVATHPRR